MSPSPYPELLDQLRRELNNPEAPPDLAFIRELSLPQAQWALEYVLGFAKGLQVGIRDRLFPD